MSEWQTAYFLEDRSSSHKPNHHPRGNAVSTTTAVAVPSSSNNTTSCSLNDTLQTQYIDLDDNDDSMYAHGIRTITSCVGSICTPKQVLGLLRILKAITLSFLILSIVANMMYILFVKILSSDNIHIIAGGTRDTILRIYGLGLSLLSIMIELDYNKVVKKFAGLKGFIARAILYFLIAQITALHPSFIYYYNNQRNPTNGYNNQAYYNNNNDDDGNADNNDNNGNDDAASQQYVSTTTQSGDNFSVPMSAIGFQRVTSLVLGFCALGYFICGLLCFDRFTARAFLSTKDPRITTALPPPPTPQHIANHQPPMDDSITNDSSTA